MSNTIHHTVFYAHPPELVWEFLTVPELMAQWLMPSNFKPVVGYDFQMRVNPIPAFDFDGIFHCKVLEIIPNKKLVYSWKAGPGDGTLTMDSIVTWQLTAKDGGTSLDLDHGAFKVLNSIKFFEGLEDGWLKNMNKIVKLLNTAEHGKPTA